MAVVGGEGGSRGQRCVFVIGNESMDVDSHVASIAYAFLLWYLEGGRERGEGKREEGDVLYVPVMNIERADFPLRGECVALFQLVGLDVRDLIFMGKRR